jgi:hypothetical protein
VDHVWYARRISALSRNTCFRQLLFPATNQVVGRRDHKYWKISKQERTNTNTHRSLGICERSYEEMRNCTQIIKAELQRRMHDPMAEVGAWLRKVVLSYYQYHPVPGNATQSRIFKLRVCRLWQSVLVRRSQRAKGQSGYFVGSTDPAQGM